MDITLLLALCSVLILIILGVILFIKTSTQSNVHPNVQERRGHQAAEDVPRRAQIVRNQRARLRANAARHDEVREEDDINEETEIIDEKIGTKKRAKLEAKAEKKALREMEEKLREEKKKRDQQADEERQKQQLKEEAEEKRREEEARKAKEEQERREHEEYLKMKEAFLVEEEGYEEGEETSNSLQDFVKYIKDNKVINIEDLAVHFRLKTQAAIDRIQDLRKDKILSGVLDDRGKFIYISMEELEAVAKFIKQRGRVSISELADSSNNLINLAPNKVLLS